MGIDDKPQKALTSLRKQRIYAFREAKIQEKQVAKKLIF